MSNICISVNDVHRLEHIVSCITLASENLKSVGVTELPCLEVAAFLDYISDDLDGMVKRI